MASLSKYDIDYDETADEETLRNQLAEFYAKRTLTHKPIRPVDQAEAIFLLASDRLSRTTGQILTVDGALHEAFLR
jgi:NAD(P)-dependent dehydrogenase (short-subunit alcohol dehydrogenase family)